MEKYILRSVSIDVLVGFYQYILANANAVI